MNNLKILHNQKEGDLLLTTLSRKDREHYSSCSIIYRGHVLHTIHTSRGPQTIEIELMEYLEHENKPIKQFRYKTEPLTLKNNSKERIVTMDATNLMISYITAPLYRNSISQYFYKEGEVEGEHKEWRNNGKLWSQSYYKEGKLEGEYKQWYHNGQLRRQMYYKDGKREGENKSWDNEGNLTEHKIYTDDDVIKDFLKN